MDKGKFILATIASAVSGTIIGMLLAPEKGSDTRKKLTKKGEAYLKELRKEIDEIRDNVNKTAQSTRKDLDDFGKDARSRGQDVLKRAKKVMSYDEWTKEELYERAKQLGVENYSTMNKAELINALREQ